MQEFVEVALPSGYKTRNKLVSGIGINDAWYITERKSADGSRSKCPYSVKWKGLMRKVSKLSKETSLPVENYIEKEWLTFSKFKLWLQTKGWKNEQLKLVKGKFYCEDTYGFIANREHRLAHGVGIFEEGVYGSTKEGSPTPEYALWFNMLSRCYSNCRQNLQPSYVGCTVSENFKNFQFFAEWCNNQIGFGLKDWHLDKDILSKGNKVYSEDTCCFVPKELNMMFSSCTSKGIRTSPIGVCLIKNTGKFSASCNRLGKKVWLGYHATEGDAFKAYKVFKESNIKEEANKWKDSIDFRVYKALIEYKVEITD